MSEAEAVLVLNKDFSVFKGGDKYVSHEDLQAVADGKVKDASQEDIDAAKYILANGKLFDRLDTAAKGGKTDDKISQEDAESYARKEAVGVLDSDFSVFTGGDKYVNYGNLLAVADGKVKDASQEDILAADYITSDYFYTFRVLDGYNARNGKEDGLISQNDASKYYLDGAPSDLYLPNTWDEATLQGQAQADILELYLEIITAP